MTPRSVTYTANGTGAVFAFDFPLFDEADLDVLVDGVRQTSGYAFVGSCFHSGGAIAFTSAPASGKTITLRRAGKVQVSESDTAGFLADKIVAGTNVTITQTSGADGQHLTIAAATNSDDALLKSRNLADLPDKAQARLNLGLGTAATKDVGTGAGQVVQLDANARLPALDGSQLTNIPVGKVQTDGTDAAGYLQDKLAAGANIAVTKVADKMTVAVTGLSAVATSGAYADLSGKPALGTAAALNVDPDGTLAADSDSLIATQKAVKTYVAANGNSGSLPTGAVVPFAGAVAPSGWLVCNGALISRATYSALFAAIGTTFGSGDGSSTFALPDLRGRAPIGAGQGSGLSNRNLGASGGEEAHTLTIAEIPNHNHTVISGMSAEDGTPAIAGVNAIYLGPSASSYTGGNGSHNTMPPFLALNVIIKT